MMSVFQVSKERMETATAARIKEEEEAAAEAARALMEPTVLTRWCMEEEERVGPDGTPKTRRRLLAEKMMAAAKADRDFPSHLKGPMIMQVARQALSLRSKMEKQKAADLKKAKKMADMAAIPKWKRDAILMKEAAAEKKKINALSKEQKQELKQSVETKKKFDKARLMSIQRQVRGYIKLICSSCNFFDVL